MSTAYEAHGRRRQKERTRQALVDAARALVAEGRTPGVDDVAERAGVSRTTAYRYFPTRHLLLTAAHPEVATPSLLPEVAPEDPVARLDLAVEAFTTLILDTEAQQRTMLRLSLDEHPPEASRLPLRQGRAIGWFTEALEPLRETLGETELHQLVLAVRSATGIEALDRKSVV